MKNFAAGFAFAIAAMMAWAAWSGEAKMDQRQLDILTLPIKQFMMAGGEDENGIARELRVNEDGSVNCRH